jgi:hypothetical protein
VTTASSKRLLFVWLVLSSMTLSYLWLDHSADRNRSPIASTAVTVSVLVIALIKVRIILREFMEVRQAPILLCRLTDGWVLLMAMLLLGSYFLGSPVSN